MKISKKEILKIVINKNRKERRKATKNFKEQIHKDKRTKRNRTRNNKNRKAIEESEE